MTKQQYFTTTQAVQYLQDRFGYGTKYVLDHGAYHGTGPPFRTFGSSRSRMYTRAALDRWALKSGPPRTTSRKIRRVAAE